MKPVFISRLKTLLDAVAEEMEVFVPRRSGEHFIFTKYEREKGEEVELNNIRTCMPIKEFLFPSRDIAASYPQEKVVSEVKPFAVFGLKDCDLKSIAILDKVFMEDEFEDPQYRARREQMFVISSDCTEPAESCFCVLFGGKSYGEQGYDLNVSQIKDGFIIEAGSRKGHMFIERHNQIFADAPAALITERDERRKQVQQELERRAEQFEFDAEAIKQIIKETEGSSVYDEQVKSCIECHACTRVCPTCHCFYLYDARQADYFVKMKMWDSCMRFSYAAVAGGANPNKALADRMQHRLMHKFVHFVERYGINMCVGCGRCVDGDAGGMDLRDILKKLADEAKGKLKG